MCLTLVLYVRNLNLNLNYLINLKCGKTTFDGTPARYRTDTSCTGTLSHSATGTADPAIPAHWTSASANSSHLWQPNECLDLSFKFHLLGFKLHNYAPPPSLADGKTSLDPLRSVQSIKHL